MEDITIESLVDFGGWKIESAYHRWGNNVLFLLCSEDITVDAGKTGSVELNALNESIVKALDSCYEFSSMYDQYMEEFPGSPFIIMEETFKEACALMNHRLKKYEGDIRKLDDDYTTFQSFQLAIHLAYDNDDKWMYKGAYDGWRTILADFNVP